MTRYRGKKVLVTGGLGFIGSNLAIRAVELGAEVTIVDSSVEGCGANPHNIDSIRDRVSVIPLDLREASDFAPEIAATDVIFNLAGEISHLNSMECPERDLDLNTTAQLRFLNVCRRVKPGVRIVYAGTRQIYGVPQYLPVDELHPINPVDFNGIHKYAATMYHLMLSRSGQLDAAVLRLTNVYGPRMALHLTSQGFVSAFLRRLCLGQDLEVFGDGSQLRDLVYVDDAVDAFLRVGICPQLPYSTYNIGGPDPLPINEIARIAAAGGGVGVTRRPFPAELRKIDIGSYCANWSRIERELGWRPRVSVAEGIERSVEFYRTHSCNYLLVEQSVT